MTSIRSDVDAAVAAWLEQSSSDGSWDDFVQALVGPSHDVAALLRIIERPGVRRLVERIVARTWPSALGVGPAPKRERRPPAVTRVELRKARREGARIPRNNQSLGAMIGDSLIGSEWTIAAIPVVQAAELGDDPSAWRTLPVGTMLRVDTACVQAPRIGTARIENSSEGGEV